MGSWFPMGNWSSKGGSFFVSLWVSLIFPASFAHPSGTFLLHEDVFRQVVCALPVWLSAVGFVDRLQAPRAVSGEWLVVHGADVLVDVPLILLWLYIPKMLAQWPGCWPTGVMLVTLGASAETVSSFLPGFFYMCLKGFPLCSVVSGCSPFRHPGADVLCAKVWTQTPRAKIACRVCSHHLKDQDHKFRFMVNRQWWLGSSIFYATTIPTTL